MRAPSSVMPDPPGGFRFPGRAIVAAVGILAATAALSSPRAVEGQAEAPADGSAAPQTPAAETERPSAASGERFFYNRTVGRGKVACADCHLIVNPSFGAPDDLIRAGHNLYDAFGRGSWWNGRVTTDSGEASEVCHKRFQGGSELSADARLALVLFMKNQAAPVSNPIVILRVPAGKAPVNEGDAARGADIYRRACAVCHSEGGPNPGGNLSTSSKSPREIADMVREGEGRMPLFQGDLLTDSQVADVAAYTWSLQPKTP